MNIHVFRGKRNRTCIAIASVQREMFMHLSTENAFRCQERSPSIEKVFVCCTWVFTSSVNSCISGVNSCTSHDQSLTSGTSGIDSGTSGVNSCTSGLQLYFDEEASNSPVGGRLACCVIRKYTTNRIL